MKVTIVTTTYNQEKYIGQAIEGMIMQKTKFPFKILISNDSSTDNTKKILEDYKQKYPDKIEVINHEKNLGAMQNFVDTLSRVKDSEYVALCDGDDFWTDENKLQKQVDFLDENKDFNICFHKSRLFYQNGEKEDEIIPHDIESETTIEDLVKQNYIVANSVVYRWKFNDRDLKNFFPENIVPGDYYIHLLHAQDGKIKMIDEVMSAYRRHDRGVWWSEDNKNKEEFTLKYGERFLNFYDQAEKNIELPEKAFEAQRKDIIYNIIVTYVKNNKTGQIVELMKSANDKRLYEECMKDIVNRNIWFLDVLKNGDEKEKQIEQYKKDIENYKSKIKKIENELSKYKTENETIKNSRWWKLRNKLKGIK